MDDIEIPTLLDNIEICVEGLLFVVVFQGHDAHVRMAEQRLPQVIEAVHVVRMSHMRMVYILLGDCMILLKAGA